MVGGLSWGWKWRRCSTSGAGRPPHPRYWAPRTAWWRRATAGAGRPRPARRQPGGSWRAAAPASSSAALGGGQRLAGLPRPSSAWRDILRLLQVLARLLQLAQGGLGRLLGLLVVAGLAHRDPGRLQLGGADGARRALAPSHLRTGRWPGPPPRPRRPGPCPPRPGRLGGGVGFPGVGFGPGHPGVHASPISAGIGVGEAVATEERHEHLAAHVEGGQHGRDPAHRPQPDVAVPGVGQDRPSTRSRRTVAPRRWPASPRWTWRR